MIPELPQNMLGNTLAGIETIGVINEILRGRQNNIGTFTLSANATQTIVENNQFSSDMIVLWMPTTASAATATGTMYVSERENGRFTITHADTTESDKTFAYLWQG